MERRADALGFAQLDDVHADPVAAAWSLVPVLRARSRATERLGRLPDETVADISRYGLFTMFKPRRHGGAQVDFSVAVEALRVLALGDVSAAWIASITVGNSLVMPQIFSPEARDEVHRDPAALVASVVSIQKFDATQVEGGIHIKEAVWSFNSGVYHAQWDMLFAPLSDAQGEMTPKTILVPTSEIEMLDDWDVMGLRATGSTTVRARDLFVPDYRISRSAIVGGKLSNEYREDALYRVPLAVVGYCLSLATVVGGARAVLDLFLEKVSGRKIMYTKYADQSQAPVTHLQMGQAASKLDAAELILRQLVSEYELVAEQDAEMDMRRRGRLRGLMALGVSLSIEAADIVAMAAGGTFISESNPINRAWRNVHCAKAHAALTVSSGYEGYGRIVCGLDPENPTF